MSSLRIILILILFVCCANAKPFFFFGHFDRNNFHDFNILESAGSPEEEENEDFDETDVEGDNNFEGDIELTQEQEEILDTRSELGFQISDRVGRLDTEYRWFKNRRGQVVVPYTIDTDAEYCE